jgi:hypothetical protein
VPQAAQQGDHHFGGPSHRGSGLRPRQWLIPLVLTLSVVSAYIAQPAPDRGKAPSSSSSISLHHMQKQHGVVCAGCAIGCLLFVSDTPA